MFVLVYKISVLMDILISYVLSISFMAYQMFESVAKVQHEHTYVSDAQEFCKLKPTETD